MNRRSLIKSLVGVAACVGLSPKVSTATPRDGLKDGHECGDYCFDSAENIARANIKETGTWKLQLHDWARRRMVVTRCGQAACEVTLASPSHHPYWEYKRRYLTREETESFHAEYGRVHWLLVSGGIPTNLQIRGFILNGRHDGWNLSTGGTVGS